jgi:hypothetical protein
MTYLEVKNAVIALLRGDNSKASEHLSDESYLSMALRDISMRCVPMVLLKEYTGSETDVFRRVRSELDEYENSYLSFYLRKPTISTIDTDEVDIDEELTQAVIYFICSYLSNKKNIDFAKMAEDTISFYNSNAVDLSQYEV